MNRDPITGEPGSHPVGTGVGSAGGAAVGAAVGAPFGPIGMLIGGAIGAVAGGAAGHAVGEGIDPTGETEYWRSTHTTRKYYDKSHDWNDYEPAYRYGTEARNRYPSWNENEIKTGWEKAKGNSRMTWERAKDAVKDAFDRSDRTYKTYEHSDRYWGNEYKNRDYFDKDMDFNRDMSPAYRYGTYSRYRHSGRNWDDSLENDLGRDWDRFKGQSRLGWDRARFAAKDAWHGVERAIPGDLDKDGR
jgi:hypothetical protein